MGEGKSTLIKLICGLYKPTSGKILLNNVNIENYNIHDYLKFISAVFQDSRLWAFTLAENITCMKNNDYDKNLLNLSIEKSDLSDKVNNLEKGIHTNIDRHLELDGIQLSGGESQKVMLARALYKEGKLMVFDEPTAALDPIAEYNTYLNFDKIIGENTALYISHRLSSTRFCDKIILLNDKKIEAVGTHKELLETNKLYREMFTIQGQYYNDQREGDLG